MSERCPLVGLNWKNELGRFPEVCEKTCSELWEDARDNTVPDIDTFEDSCNGDVDYCDESLQRIGGSKRGFGVLYVCSLDGQEAFAEEYVFDCPNG